MMPRNKAMVSIPNLDLMAPLTSSQSSRYTANLKVDLAEIMEKLCELG
jgi:hypothetical protein